MFIVDSDVWCLCGIITPEGFKSLWQSNATLYHRIWSTSVNGNGLLLHGTKPLPGPIYWLFISQVLWLSPDGNFTQMLRVFIFESKSNFQTDIKFWHQFENYVSKITAPPHCKQWVNSLWPSDTIWRHKSGSTLDQVMACCLTAPSHYLNQCWLIIIKVQ